MPPLVLCPAISMGPSPLFLRGALGSILRSENNIGGMTKDLIFGITEQTLSAHIPAGGDAVGVRGKDGKIDRALDNELKECLLARPCSFKCVTGHADLVQM